MERIFRKGYLIADRKQKCKKNFKRGSKIYFFIQVNSLKGSLRRIDIRDWTVWIRLNAVYTWEWMLLAGGLPLIFAKIHFLNGGCNYLVRIVVQFPLLSQAVFSARRSRSSIVYQSANRPSTAASWFLNAGCGMRQGKACAPSGLKRIWRNRDWPIPRQHCNRKTAGKWSPPVFSARYAAAFSHKLFRLRL